MPELHFDNPCDPANGAVCVDGAAADARPDPDGPGPDQAPPDARRDARPPVDAAPPGDAGPPPDGGLPADAAVADAARPPDAGPPPPDAGCVPAPERCNDRDDDCDGRTDEQLGLGEPCMAGVGDCQRAGTQRCGRGEAVVCGAEPGRPEDERCDRQDNDCDGSIDEDTEGFECAAGQGECRRIGGVRCVAGRSTCDATPGPAHAEVCNELDDDCDGSVDEGGICAAYLLSACRVFLGQAIADAAPDTPFADWPGCDFNGEDVDGANRCVSTSGDQRMHTTVLNPAVGGSTFVIRFDCQGEDPALDLWMRTHCGLGLAITPNDANLGGVDVGACPDAWPRGRGGDPRCVISSGDGLYHPLVLDGPAGWQTPLGLAFGCEDPQRPGMAASLNAETRVDWMVWVGPPVGPLQCRSLLPRNLSVNDACDPRQEIGSVCSATADAPGFTTLIPPGVLEGCWGLGAALRLVP
ncbi:MAG: MopE-related protein [bacterium]